MKERISRAIQIETGFQNVVDLTGLPFVIALGKSHLPLAYYWFNTESSGRTTDLNRL